MEGFALELPTKIYFGNDIVEEALRKESKWFAGNIMIVTTGKSLVRYGYLEELNQILHQMPGIRKVIIFDKISANPKLKEIEEAIVIGKQENVKTIIGFGGGSSLDAAKAAAAGIGTGEKLERFLLEGKEPSDVLPIIAIPTTAGTGSELSRGAIISSPEHHIKAGIRGKNILPKVAIVNPAYTWTVPENTTMETGFDALAHAIESYVAVKANLWSEMLSEKAIKAVAKSLPLLLENMENHEAREAISYASMIMGINLANVGTCLPHRMQYAIGAQTDTGHALGVAALYPAWIEKEYQVNTDKVKNIIYWLTDDEVQTGKEAKKKMTGFMKKIKVLKTLSSLGIEAKDIEKLAEQVTGNIANDKLSSQENVIADIFIDSL